VRVSRVGRYQDAPPQTRPARVGGAGPGLGFRPADTLAFLLGGWRIERVLADARSGYGGTFAGTATFWPQSGARTARYQEDGELRFGGYSGPAGRSLEYLAAGGAADVRFADGREFYRLDLRGGRCRARHRCGADRYQLTGRILGEDRYQERWLVHGPEKSIEIVSTLTRLGPPGQGPAADGPDRQGCRGTSVLSAP
jgi:hypothetical protein